MRLNIDCDLVKQLTGQRTASKWITSLRWVDTWACNVVMWYWSVAILFWQLSIDHIVNVQYKRHLPRHIWDTPPFLLIVSPTPPIQFVDACTYINAWSITWQPNEKRLTIYGYGALSTLVGALLQFKMMKEINAMFTKIKKNVETTETEINVLSQGAHRESVCVTD